MHQKPKYKNYTPPKKIYKVIRYWPRDLTVDGWPDLTSPTCVLTPHVVRTRGEAFCVTLYMPYFWFLPRFISAYIKNIYIHYLIHNYVRIHIYIIGIQGVLESQRGSGLTGWLLSHICCNSRISFTYTKETLVPTTHLPFISTPDT